MVTCGSAALVSSLGLQCTISTVVSIMMTMRPTSSPVRQSFLSPLTTDFSHFISYDT